MEEKARIIQELVPGKQVTIAHLIAHPDEDLAKKMGEIRQLFKIKASSTSC